MAVLSYMTSNNITGVRGNHDQKVIEWRGWINWIRSLPAGKEWLENLDTRWVVAEVGGASPDMWVEKEKKNNKSKWWKTIPKGWILFGDHFKVARAMSRAQYDYLLSLPIRLYIPSAHTFIVHAGLLPSDPLYPPTHFRQPLAHVPSLPLAITKGKPMPKNDTITLLRGLQELSLLKDVPQNKVPWTVLNIRSIFSGKVSRCANVTLSSPTMPAIYTSYVAKRTARHGPKSGSTICLAVKDSTMMWPRNPKMICYLVIPFPSFTATPHRGALM